MTRRDWYIIITILFGSAIIAFSLNWLLSIDGFIPTDFTPSEWLLFWATYITGIFALIIGYLAISFANKNSEKALAQQTNLLIKQDNERIKGEILGMIKSQYQLFNVMKHCSTFLTLDHDDIPNMIKRVVDDRANVYDHCNEWSLYFQMNLQHPALAGHANEYQKCWSESVSVLDNYLKLQIEYLQKVRIVDNAIESRGLYDQILLNMNQQLQMPADIRSSNLETEIKTYQHNRDSKQQVIDVTNEEIKELLSRTNLVQASLIEAQDKIEKASLVFLNIINQIDFQWGQ